MRSVFSKILIAVVFVMFMCSTGIAGGIELTDNVVTGMNYNEVNEEINLEHTASQRDLDIFRRYVIKNGDKKLYNAYYCFNGHTGELIYKLLYMDGDVDEKVEDLKENASSVIEEGGTYFFSKEGSDLGYKIMDNESGDDQYQLWVGSISLWDDLAEENSLNTFEKEW